MSAAKKPVAFVTGAGWWPEQSRGLGWAIAYELADAGHTVVVSDKEEEPAERSADDLRAHGFDAYSAAMDVTDVEQVTETIGRVIKDRGGIDALANAAALTLHRWGLKPFHEITAEQCDIELNITLKGALNTTRAVLPHMYERGSGAIVFIGSVLAFDPAPRQTLYGICKSALVSFTKSLGAEAGPHGVRVNCVCPGIMQTRVADALPDKYMDIFLKQTAMHRAADPREVARVVRFLVSDDASYVNGEAIRVDGGETGVELGR